MRAKEFLSEASIDDIIEDEAETRGDKNLANALESWRNQVHGTHKIPRIRVDTLVKIMRKMPGTEMFTIENLMAAYKDNETVKNLVKEIKEDADGIKYVYLKTFADEPETGDDMLGQAAGEIANPEKTIDLMAKRALKKRS